MLAALLAGVVAAVVVVRQDDARPRSQPRTIVIDIPRGTAARVARGEPTAVVGDRIVARVGDALRLVNHDRVVHVIAGFPVSPGQTVAVPLLRAGTFETECSVHTDNAVGLVVH